MSLKEIAIIIAQGLLVLFFIYLIGVGLQTPRIIENLEMREDEKRISPHKLGELFDIKFVQSSDVMTLVHSNHEPAELRRYGATNWQFANIDFTA